MSRFIIYTIFLCLCQVYGQSSNGESDCICVPFYLCVNGTINTDGQGIVDIRAQLDECESYLEVCCDKKSVIDEVVTRSPAIKKKTGCGYRNRNGVGYRITGDVNNEAQFGEFPWMVAILHKGAKDVQHTYKCGGSLIHPQVVLTAAHCIVGGSSFRVRAGEWDSKTTEEIFKHQERKATGGVVHRSYSKRTLVNDIALLFLESPIDMASHINFVCLPPSESIILSDECFVTGWGRSKFEKDDVYQNILKRIQLPMLPREACQNAFRTTRLGRFFKLDRSFNCAGGEEGQDACTGDGGGPLVCPIAGQEDRYQQVGIIAWGIGCGTRGVPGAYTDVAYLRNWIDQQMNKNNFNLSSYQF